MSEPRRRFMQKSAAAAAASLASVQSVAWAAGSDAPEKKEVRVGFIPLTDCASVVMAAVNKFDEKYGVKIIPTKEASWAAVRDKLVMANSTRRTCSTASSTACTWASAVRRRTWPCS
jgi:nitrate/nitrite transport system substrate-binding protein